MLHLRDTTRISTKISFNCANGIKEKNTTPIVEQGNFFNMDFHMSQYLFQTALQLSNGVREAGCNSTETQSDKKEK